MLFSFSPCYLNIETPIDVVLGTGWLNNLTVSGVIDVFPHLNSNCGSFVGALFA